MDYILIGKCGGGDCWLWRASRMKMHILWWMPFSGRGWTENAIAIKSLGKGDAMNRRSLFFRVVEGSEEGWRLLVVDAWWLLTSSWAASTRIRLKVSAHGAPRAWPISRCCMIVSMCVCLRRKMLSAANKRCAYSFPHMWAGCFSRKYVKINLFSTKSQVKMWHAFAKGFSLWNSLHAKSEMWIADRSFVHNHVVAYIVVVEYGRVKELLFFCADIVECFVVGVIFFWIFRYTHQPMRLVWKTDPDVYRS